MPRWSLALGYFLVGALAVSRVASTVRVFSATADEPTHIASGLDWLHGLPYTADPYQPPLERVLSALPAFLDHIPVPPPGPDTVTRGDAILYSGGEYVHNVGRARFGNLLFLVIGIAATAGWGARRLGPIGGLVAAALYAWLPPIRAHAGLATPDMAVAALVPLALLSFDRWLDAPTPARTGALGLALGVGALSKFSFLLFFSVAATVLLAVRVFRRTARGTLFGALGAVALASVIVWAGYRFELGTIAGSDPAAAEAVAEMTPARLLAPATWVSSHVVIPAPLFAGGILSLKFYDLHGHDAFLFGEIRHQGWWYYFPVALFFKTPLPFLVLSLVGTGLILARKPEALDVALIPLAILVSVLPSSIDVGIRHLLPIYSPLAVAAAYGAIALKDAIPRLVAIALIVWMILGTELEHPDYLAWFNVAAGPHPERILVDSNLDWGQDYLRLVDTLRRRRILHVRVLEFGTVQLWKHDIDAQAAVPATSAPGWYVVSESALALNSDARRGAYRWLDRYPFERIGKSIRLYRVPETRVPG